MPTQKSFEQILVYVKLYQHAKNQAISLICSRDMVDKKILQSDWLKTFWPISQEQRFSQLWDLCRNTANNIYFHYRINSVKINDQINSKNPVFSIFPNFRGKKIFSGKSSSVTYNFIWDSSIIPKFIKN